MKKTFKGLIILLCVSACIMIAAVFAACSQSPQPPQQNGENSGTIPEEPPQDEQFFTLKYSAQEGGRIDGDAEQTVKSGENGNTVVAVAETGYNFLGWSDGYRSAIRQDVSVSKDIAVTARFSKRTLVVNYKTEGAGTISGGAAQVVPYGEASNEVTAVPDEGAYFVEWSDGKKEPVRSDIITSNTIITAKFEYFEYTVTLVAPEHGRFFNLIDRCYIEEKVLVLNVTYGKSVEGISIDPDSGYYFDHWESDGEIVSRSDAVTHDMTIIGVCSPGRRNIRFTAENGGRITGDRYQEVHFHEYCQEVIAVPDEGYEFAGWSNGSVDAHLTLYVFMPVSEGEGSENVYEFEFKAYFRPLEKHFAYDCGDIPVTPPEEGITLKKSELANAEFFIPETPGQIFLGWYADKEYKVKVAGPDGRYMLGYYGLELETETLYAKFASEGGDGKIVHKILFVMPQEIHVSLKTHRASSWDEKLLGPYPELPEYLDVDYYMSPVEYTGFKMVIEKFEEALNEWFENTDIRFEVDSYYTLSPLTRECFITSGDLSSNEEVSYGLHAYNIPEIGELNSRYHNVIVLQAMHDYFHFVSEQSIGGAGGAKYATVFMDTLFSSAACFGRPFEYKLEEERYIYRTDTVDGRAYVAMHEFCHTCESYFTSYDEPILEWHNYTYYGSNIDTKNLSDKDYFCGAYEYLLGEAEYEGRTSKVLKEKYWINDFEIPYNYTCGGGTYCKVFFEGGVEATAGCVPYGATQTVIAVPNEGYRFVRWSDGVTTEKRTDKNIISNLIVYPIVVEKNALVLVQRIFDINKGEFVEGVAANFIITYNGEQINYENSEMNFPLGTVITLEVCPLEGYEFVEWNAISYNGKIQHEREKTITLTIDSYVKIEAYFVKLNI